MAVSNISYKCPTCGAELFWSAEKGCFDCIYCGDTFSLEDLKAAGAVVDQPIDETKVEHAEEIVEGEYTQTTDGTVSNDFVKYTCSHCGAEIITDRSTAATICVYCGNAVIMSEQIIADFAPDYVIPFKVQKNKVMSSFKEFSKKPLTPKDFDCEKVVDKMQGVYIPFWLYSGKCDGRIEGEGINEKTWTSGNYRYTEKKYYDIMRDGTVNFEKVPVDGSSKTEDAAMDSIEPFDFKDMVAFTPAYLSGFLAERFDEDADKCFPRAQERIENTTRQELEDSAKYDTVDVKNYQKQTTIEKTEYAMFPTWLLYTTYNDEKFFFAMNGQTGKFIGNLPISKPKLILYSLIGGIGGSILGSIIATFMN
ncbi:hypothetical protein SAMN02910447_02276 [Ruminococcus sp. YE71]|uniref:hypothetical protein n=1 Tax=unclassified Ruminococcus TaxID=2608920 RepID=UPI000889348D|nr:MULTISPECIES: hypothetical protein [unclassified Ruminococcus]SDA23066.1 hypothetical protein SAMN02910446_02144 [Ruminococcus sp. YE78]SFW39225.1 hypothetical protein SAMN02910447_02276 [Ruminococcus sp. YE71]